MSIKVIKPYTEKSFVVVGDTKSYKDDFSKLFTCRYNPNLQNKENPEEKMKGWVFGLKSYDNFKKYLTEKNIQVEYIELEQPYTMKKSKEESI